VSEPLFVGRLTELDAITAAVDAARHGQSSVVWIAAPAGAGKSALVRQAVTQLGAGLTVLRGRGDEMAADVDGALLQTLGVTPERTAFATGLRLLGRLTAAVRPRCWSSRTCTGWTRLPDRRCWSPAAGSTPTAWWC
jgi:hypothetical protein